jgi:release factor glutamine methyltransferase
MKTLAPELAFEPRLALTDEGDGLSVLHGVLETAARTLTAGGILLTEIGSGQGSDACEMARALPFREIRVLKDLAGRDRVLSAVRAEDR